MNDGAGLALEDPPHVFKIAGGSFCGAARVDDVAVFENAVFETDVVQGHSCPGECLPTGYGQTKCLWLLHIIPR
jgi:hypothetical protein